MGVDPNAISSTTPVGSYNRFGLVAVVAGSTASAVDFELAFDTTPPTSGITSPVEGSTLTALSTISGTSADDFAGVSPNFAAQDLTAGLWWDVDHSVWVDTTTAPLYFQTGFTQTGPPSSFSWAVDVSTSGGFGGFSGYLVPGHRYVFYATNVDVAGNREGVPAVVSFTWNGPLGGVQPQAPGGISGYGLGVSSIAWAWGLVQGATSYTLYDSSTGAVIGTSSTNSFTQTGLSTNAVQGICVSATNLLVEGPRNCGGGIASTLAAVPGQPQAVQVSSFSIAWIWDSGGNPSYTGYRLAVSTDNFASGPGQTFQAGQFGAVEYGLSPATLYFARVAAISAGGAATAYSSVGSTMTLKALPGGIAAIDGTALGVSSIAWTWTAADAAASYNVYSSTGGLAATVSATAYFEVGLATNTADSVCVSGVNAAGEGPKKCASPVFTLAAAPGPLSFHNVSYNGFSIAWDGGSNVPTGYQVQLSTDGFVSDIRTPVPFSAGLQTTTTGLLGLSAETTYYLRVQGENADDILTSFSPTASVRTLKIPIPSIDYFTLQDGALISRPQQIFVEVSDGAGISQVVFSIDGVAVSTQTSPPYGLLWDTRKYPDGPHAFSVAATNILGKSTAAVRNVTLSYAPPAAPIIRSPANGFETSIATINVSGTAEPYTAVDLLINGLDVATAAVTGNSWSFGSVLVANAGQVVLTAVAFEPQGFSAPSAAVTGFFSSGAPNTPTLVGADSAAGGIAHLTWSAPAGGNAAFYRIYRSNNDLDLPEGGPAPAASFRVADNVSQTSYDDLPAVDDLYFYAITAVDGLGRESPLSEEVYALTDRTAPTASLAFANRALFLVPGVYGATLTISEPLSTPPILTFTPPSSGPAPLALTAVTATVWLATVTVTSDMNSGFASFAFQGVDLAGNVGLSISAPVPQLHTGGPVGAVALGRSSPVDAGLLSLTLTLDSPAVGTPSLAVLPATGAAIPVSLVSVVDNSHWTGSVAITSSTGDGQASFAYAAVDQTGITGRSLFGGATFFVIDTVPPNPPVSLRANLAPAGRVLLSWSQPLGKPAAAYKVYRDGIGIAGSVSPQSDGTGFYTDTAPDGTHQYQVTSVDLAGNESAAAQAQATARSTPPAAPVNLTAAINASGQVEIDWGETDPAANAYRLYRATFAIASITGLPFKSAATIYTETPVQNAFYHYAVTALDFAGNESSPSAEAAVLFQNSAPVITISGVADGGFYNQTVTPAFLASDVSLATGTVHSSLNGAPFASGTAVSADGAYSLSVSASNTGGHSASASANFTIVRTPPAISFSGVASGAVVASTSGLQVQISVASLDPGTSSFILTNQTLQTNVAYNSGDPILRTGQYSLSGTATDKAGNVSTAAISFSLEVAPPPPVGLSIIIQGGAARLSWASPEADVVGYRVYRDGSRVSAALLQDISFLDTGYSPGPHVYGVSAVDAKGVEGSPAQATVPAAVLSLAPGGLTRGFLDAVQPVVENDGGSPLVAGPALVQVISSAGIAASAAIPAVSAPAGQTTRLQGVVATPLNLDNAASIHVNVAVGPSVALAGDFPVVSSDPPQPLIEAFPDAFFSGSTSRVRVRLYNRGSAAMDVVTAQLAPPANTAAASPSIQARLKTVDGTLLSYNSILQSGNGANLALLNGQEIFFVTIPPGSSFLFDPIALAVPSGGLTSIQLQVDVSTPVYSLAFNTVRGSRAFTSLSTQTVSALPPYRASVAANASVYDQASPVVLSGQASDSLSGFPVPAAAVAVHVLANGTDRELDSVADSSGNYTATFSPLPNEAGIYTVSAAHPSVASRAAQSSFTITGFGFSPASLPVTMGQGKSTSFSVQLANVGATGLSGLAYSIDYGASAGLSLAVASGTLPQALAAGAKAAVGLSLSASTAAAGGTVSLSVTESHGFSRTLPISVAAVPPQVLASATPNQLMVGLLGGETRTVAVTLKNSGFDTWRNVNVTAPALSWVTILGSSQVGDIAPGQSANLTLQIAPPSTLPNQTYSQTPLIQALSDNAAAVPINASIAVTSTRKGDVILNAVNADKPRNFSGQGVGIASAAVTLVLSSSK